jgi:hypothetical protein
VRPPRGVGLEDARVAALDLMLHELSAVVACPGGKKYAKNSDGTYEVICYDASKEPQVRELLRREQFTVVRSE